MIVATGGPSGQEFTVLPSRAHEQQEIVIGNGGMGDQGPARIGPELAHAQAGFDVPPARAGTFPIHGRHRHGLDPRAQERRPVAGVTVLTGGLLGGQQTQGEFVAADAPHPLMGLGRGADGRV